MSKAIRISIEGLSEELLAAYAASGMDRGKDDQKGLHWLFGENPSAFAVARYNERIAGVSAYIKSQMKLGDSYGTGVQAVDSFVTPDMRGKGVFTQLAQAYDLYAEANGIDLVWGFPNEIAASAWFGKLGWHSHGQVPFLIKPLRSGIFFRKINLNIDIPISFSRNQGIDAVEQVGDWGDVLWSNVENQIGCSTKRDRSFLSHRLIHSPHADRYSVVVDSSLTDPAVVSTREANKHGGRIAYLMEALGGESLLELLMSELGRLRDRGTEAVLGWSFPWSPNYRTLRKAGFIPFPERFRPINIWFGTRPKLPTANCANMKGNWYLSYLDSDTV